MCAEDGVGLVTSWAGEDTFADLVGCGCGGDGCVVCWCGDA